MNLLSLSDLILQRAKDSTRHLVAVVGPPGAGKSTLAADLQDALAAKGESCALVPMDGFHLDNVILKKLGLLERKGAPNTFDTQGFVQLIKRLSAGEQNVYVPVFNRDWDIAVAGAACVEASCRIVLVEGNYLFLNQEDWSQLSSFWDTGVLINPGMPVIETRLIQRWLDQGLSAEEAELRVNNNDLPNAITVMAHSDTSLADVTIDSDWKELA